MQVSYFFVAFISAVPFFIQKAQSQTQARRKPVSVEHLPQKLSQYEMQALSTPQNSQRGFFAEFVDATGLLSGLDDGDSNEERISTYSEHGYNCNSYIEYTFNSFFNQTAFIAPPHWLFVFAKQNIELLLHAASKSEIGLLLKYKWDNFVASFLNCFEADEGAIFFDEHEEIWMFCGWVRDPIFNRYSLKICNELEAFGMEEPAREPVPFKDYIPNDSADSLRILAKQRKDSKQFREKQNQTARYYSYENNTDFDPAAYQTVAIFESSSYETNCTTFSFPSSSSSIATFRHN